MVRHDAGRHGVVVSTKREELQEKKKDKLVDHPQSQS
jgi:hypothetical protein